MFMFHNYFKLGNSPLVSSYLTTDLSTLTVVPCVRWFHCFSYGLQVGSSFFMVLQILSGFSLKFTIPKKTNQTTQSPAKNILQHFLLHTKKINNSVIFDSETSTRSSPGNDCPVNYQKFYEDHLASINLNKSALFRYSFCNKLEISYNLYQKCLCWSASSKEAHY